MKSFVSIRMCLYSYVNAYTDIESNNYPNAHSLPPKNLACQRISSTEVEARGLLISEGVSLSQ